MEIRRDHERQAAHEGREGSGGNYEFSGWNAPALDGEAQCCCLHHDGEHDLGLGRCRHPRCLCAEFVQLEDLGAGGAA